MNMTPEEYYQLLSSRTEREEIMSSRKGMNDISKPPSYDEQLLLRRRLREIEQIEKMQEMEQQRQLEQERQMERMRRERMEQNLKQEQLQDLWEREGQKGTNGNGGNGDGLRMDRPQPNVCSGASRYNNRNHRSNSFSRSYTAPTSSENRDHRRNQEQRDHHMNREQREQRELRSSRTLKRSSHDLLTCLTPEELEDMYDMSNQQHLMGQRHQNSMQRQFSLNEMHCNLRNMESDRWQFNPRSFHESLPNSEWGMERMDRVDHMERGERERRYRRANSDSINPMDFLCKENGHDDSGERYHRSNSGSLNPMDFLYDEDGSHCRQVSEGSNGCNGSHGSFDEFAQQNQLFGERTTEPFDASFASFQSASYASCSRYEKFADGSYYRRCHSNGRDFQEDLHHSMPMLHSTHSTHRFANNEMYCQPLKPLKRRKQDGAHFSPNKSCSALNSFSMPASAPTVMKRSAIDKTDIQVVQPVRAARAVQAVGDVQDKTNAVLSPGGMAEMAKFYFIDPEDEDAGNGGAGSAGNAGLPPPPLFQGSSTDGKKDNKETKEKKKRSPIQTDVFVPSAITLQISKLSEEIRSTFEAANDKETKDKPSGKNVLNVPNLPDRPVSSSDAADPKANTANAANETKASDNDATSTTSSLSKLPKFATAMEASQFSQQSIHDWDRRFGLRRAHSKTMRESSRSRQMVLELMKEDFVDKKVKEKLNASCSNVTNGSMENSSASLDFDASSASLMSAPPVLEILEKEDNSASENGASKQASFASGAASDSEDVAMTVDTKTMDANQDDSIEDQNGYLVQQIPTKSSCGSSKKKEELDAPLSPALSLIFEDDDDVSEAFSNISIVGDELDDPDDPNDDPNEDDDLCITPIHVKQAYFSKKSEGTSGTTGTIHTKHSSYSYNSYNSYNSCESLKSFGSKASDELVQMLRRASLEFVEFVEQEVAGNALPPLVKRQFNARSA